MQKTLKKRIKQTRKILKNEEKERWRIQGKSNNNKHLWFFLLYKTLYFVRKHNLKKVVYTITFYLQFLCVAGYLKRSNDTSKLICYRLRDLVSFVQFKQREIHPWRSVNFLACNFTKINTLPWVFFTFFKLYKCYQNRSTHHILENWTNYSKQWTKKKKARNSFIMWQNIWVFSWILFVTSASNFSSISFILPLAEAATGGVLWEKVLLEILQNSQEKICTRVYFIIKLQASNWEKKRGVFLWILRNF